MLIQGFPGKSVCHGALGWSSIVLLRGHGHTALVDVGSFGVREVVIAHLARLGLQPEDITDVLLTHAHHDHCVNWPMFDRARIVVGRAELDWAVAEPAGRTPVPEFYVRELQRWPRLHLVADGDTVLPNVTALAVPGHTPGSLAYLLDEPERRVIFAGDAAKNRVELLGGRADGSLDHALSTRSIARLDRLWQERPETIMVPGHDRPMLRTGDGVRYLAAREAAITVFDGTTLEETTLFDLAAPSAQ